MDSPFTQQDNIIDIISAFAFLFVIINAVYAIYTIRRRKNGGSKTKLVFAVFGLIGVMHIYQTIVQVTSLTFASFRLWDLINYATAFAMLGSIQMMSRHYHANFRDRKKDEQQ